MARKILIADDNFDNRTVTVEILEAGGSISQETRLFDSTKGETRTMRSKEDAMDYRYFPDPDLLPLLLSQEYVDNIKRTLPELPDAKFSRFKKNYNLKGKHIVFPRSSLPNFSHRCTSTSSNDR